MGRLVGGGLGVGGTGGTPLGFCPLHGLDEDGLDLGRRPASIEKADEQELGKVDEVAPVGVVGVEAAYHAKDEALDAD